MARFFKKRARPSGPNKNEQKVMRNQGAGRTGPLAQAYPGVANLSIKLQFIGPQQQVIDSQERAFGPSDPCDLSVPCPGRCGSGAFDLAAKIAAVIEGRQDAADAGGVCQEPLYAGSAEMCGLRLQCRIQISYQPAPAE